MSKISMTIIAVIFTMTAISQSRMDSLMMLRKLDSIEGKLPAYYTPGYKDITRMFQSTVTSAINYYETKYAKPFKVKLTVLDSVQWLKEIVGFGFVFYNSGWIAMNTGMDYPSFISVYKAENFKEQLEHDLNKKRIQKDKLVNAFLTFYSIHELGHYFIGRLSDAKSPDRWTNEFIATYFAYEFFKTSFPDILKTFEIFCQVNKDFYKPNYSSIRDFDEKYSGMGLANYLWYHSNFYFLAKSLYKQRGKEFLTLYEKEFPKSFNEKLEISDIISRLDKYSKGDVAKWVSELESRTKN
jgi:hypothetical protein